MLTRKALKIQEILRDWNYTVGRIEQLNEELEEMQFSITSNTDPSGITGGGGKSSKVENFCIRKQQKEAELQQLERPVKEISRISREVLSREEFEIVWCMMQGLSLSDYARIFGIYQSTVYKKKDEVLEKLARYIDSDLITG